MHKEKQPFKFLLGDGSISILVDSTQLRDLGYSEEYITERLRQQTAHYLSCSIFEQEWRNNEYDLTDYMLLPYSKYKNEVLANSVKLEEIVQYRSELHSYLYKTDQPRPIRPSWFNKP